MAAPTIIDPGINHWKGIMSLDCVYAPPESTWGGGYDWGDAACIWGNGLHYDNNWGFDMQYDLDDGNGWITCLMVDGANGSNHDMNTYSWKQYLIEWDMAGQLNSGSDNCTVRTRIYNRNTAAYSDWGEYGPVQVSINPFPIFLGFGDGVSYRWQPESPSDYPQDIFRMKTNIDNERFVTGRIESAKHGLEKLRFSVFFPSLSEADLTAWNSFIQSMDYKSNAIIYREYECNVDSPFANTWISKWVKIENDVADISHIKTGYYSLRIDMRATAEELVA